MRVPVSWLKEYVDVDRSVEELAELLTNAGLEVGKVDYIGIPGGHQADRLIWDAEKIVVGQILRIDPHPNADRLVLATVEYGGAEPEVTVTGAPNLFPYLAAGDLSERNLFAPFALEGAELYDGHQGGSVKMTLKGRSLRGIHNRCMLCSEKELGLSDDHEGIMLLEGQFTPGTPLQAVLGDAVLEIDIIPNIARCASIVGVAREVAALTGQPIRYPDYSVHMDGPPVNGRLVIRTTEPELNPRFVGLIIEGVEQRPSPQWMQRRLILAGQRPINVVVDISNYVMLEMGQPNHTFDYDFLRRRADRYDPDGPVEIITRLAAPGETLTTLDGETRTLPPYTILVTDPAGALSLGGIMGGEESEIGVQTTNVLLEAAAWNFINIRRSADALKINSDASFRFSRGVHPSQALLGARRAAELLRRYAGGTVCQGIVDYYPALPAPVTIALESEYVRRLSGVDLSTAEIAELLARLEFEVVREGDRLRVTVPDHRLDVSGPHDLVEEVCRMVGYDRIPTTQMSDTLPPQRGNKSLEQEEWIKDSLVRQGLREVITYRLTTAEREAKLLPPALGVPPDDRPYVTLANPISLERVKLRHSLLASALEVAAANSRFQAHIAVFEIGKVFLVGEEGGLPEEPDRLALVLSGPRQPGHWQGAGEPAAYDFFDLKGVIETLLADLHVTGWTVEPLEHPIFRPGRTARWLINGRHAGTIGELHPLVVEAFDMRLETAVLAADFALEPLLDAIPDSYQVDPITPYPAVHEDLAVMVDQAVPAADVVAVIWRSGGRLLKQVDLFDVYQGEQLGAGRKSLAYHLTYQAADHTLTDNEVARLRERIVRQLEQRLGARLRQ